MTRHSNVTMLLLCAVALTACPRRRLDPLDNPKGLAPLQLTIQHLDGAESWGAVYQFPNPVTEAIFERQSYPYRDRWRVISPQDAAVIVADDATTRVTTPGSAEAFDTLVIELEDEKLPPIADLPLVQRWSDGSRLVFTGHLTLIPCAPEGCPESIELSRRLQIPHVLRFVPRDGEHAVVGGQIIRDSGHWRATGAGTYAYFGKTTPVERPHLIAVVDAKMPAWLRERTESLLPQLFDVYGGRTGKALPERPVVLLGYSAEAEPGRLRMSGSAVAGSLQLQIALGSEFQSERHPEVIRRLFRFTAHEAGHLWFGQLFQPEEAADLWLQEGAIDALSLRALTQLKLLDDTQARERLSVDLTRCVAESAAGLMSWQGFHDTEACATTIGLYTEAALRQKQPGQDLFDVWRTVFERASKGRYSANMYFTVVGQMAGADAERRARALASPGTRTPALIRATLEEAGVKITEGTQPPSAFNRYLGQLAVRHVLQQACTPSPEAVATIAPGCERIRELSDVIEIAGRRPGEGRPVYEEVSRLCAEGGEIPMRVPESATQAFKLPCTQPLPAVPAYLQVDYAVPTPSRVAR